MIFKKKKQTKTNKEVKEEILTRFNIPNGFSKTEKALCIITRVANMQYEDVCYYEQSKQKSMIYEDLLLECVDILMEELKNDRTSNS